MTVTCGVAVSAVKEQRSRIHRIIRFKFGALERTSRDYLRLESLRSKLNPRKGLNNTSGPYGFRPQLVGELLDQRLRRNHPAFWGDQW